MTPSSRDQGREFLKDAIRLELDFSQTDQARGVEPPPLEKPFAPEARRIDLPPPDRWKDVPLIDLATAVGRRHSRRRFTDRPLTLDELSFLLWATQGVRKRSGSGTILRTVPSAGNRHALETYLAVVNVLDVSPGVYRYLPLEHQLLFEFSEERLPEKLTEATLGQSFVGAAAAVFCWAAVPYRMEWRYGLASYKVLALDAGHVCQNLYLACEAVAAGTCAVGAYHQQKIDRLLRLDGKEEFTIYLAPVGKV
ncbi:MAG: SagB/ThcOx family dehydrogenase [Pirellulales bacterium]|nr:SagB/ThcOx family dehydrogenase [Pirellulales bacterium]